MSNERYLYGAAVQGIQNFIFQTNELKDIVGASELVERVCTDTCNNLIEKEGVEVLTRAAGKIRCVFESREDCEALVRVLPMQVALDAPGITLSQAVVCFDVSNPNGYKDANETLENRLRGQRNRLMPSTQIGLMGIKRSVKTGLPVCYGTNGMDIATSKKKAACDEVRDKLMDKLYGDMPKEKRLRSANFNRLKGDNSWLAMVHIDGNGLGEKIKEKSEEKDGQEQIKSFSHNLDEATKRAARKAVKQLDDKKDEEGKDRFKRIPILPIVLSGDDFTFVCRASVAVEFVNLYLKEFENETAVLDGLTACAGIAFMKSSYPYYYAYNLAEELCGEAKKRSNRKASCMMMHKIQDSFVEEYDEIVKRELTPQPNLSFCYGPYYLNQSGKPTIKALLDDVIELEGKEGNAVKSHLRQWMTELHRDPEMAKQKAKRVSSLLGDVYQTMFDRLTQWRNAEAKVFEVYDLLSLASVTYQDTKNED